MERLKVAIEDEYSPIEASIHVARYALALPFASGRRVLDAACGEGYGSWLLAKAGATEVQGIDVSADAIARAKATFKDPRISFSAGEGEALAKVYPADSFDFVVSIETIEHVADPVCFLRAIRKVAKKDAIILLTCPNDHWYYPPHESNPHHRRKFTSSEFQALTRDVLGDDVQWLIGSASLGFTAVPEAAETSATGRNLPDIVNIAASDLQLRVPSAGTAPAPENCSYFAGVWRAPQKVTGAGAFHVLSMDIYARMMAAYGAGVPLEREPEDRTPKGRALAAALRRENDILSESIQNHAVKQAEAVAARDAAYQERKSILRERDAALARAAAFAQERDATLVQWNLVVQERDAALAQRNAVVQERDAALAARDELLPAAMRWRALVQRVNSLSPTAARLAARWLRWRLTPR